MMNPFDAEHPLVIPMDLPSPHQAPRGPMTRARARALETEVNSFLFELHSNSRESWVLPQTKILCIFRYEENDHGEIKTETQAPKEKEEESHGKRQE